MSEVVLVQEAYQERQIAEIAKQIADRPNVKFVLIAGPSSSGKTTFSHRLSIELRVNGMRPHPIAVDNYFVDREQTPKDENGNYNFECLEAIDVKQFNEDMQGLLAGEEVILPIFDFKAGKRTASHWYGIIASFTRFTCFDQNSSVILIFCKFTECNFIVLLLLCAYAFTAPFVRPLTIYFCIKMKIRGRDVR